MADEFFNQFVEDLERIRAEVDAFALKSVAAADTGAALELARIKLQAEALLTKSAKEVHPLPSGEAREDAACNAMHDIWTYLGFYQNDVARLNAQPFNIKPKRRGTDHEIYDFVIIVSHGVISDEARDLKLRLDAACSTVKSVMADRRARIGLRDVIARTKAVDDAEAGYMEDLVGIANVGLRTTEPSRVAFARADLERLKVFFTIREAGIVKNSYVNELFRWCALCAFLFVMLYVVARARLLAPLIAAYAPRGDWVTLLYDTRNFHLFAAGAAIGTWLSFSLRRPELQFEDLAVLEPDRLSPSTRVVYTVGLASFVALLLFSGAVVAGVGPVSGEMALHNHGSWSLMIGLLAGIAERALGKGVKERSDALAAAIGGGVAAASGKP